MAVRIWRERIRYGDCSEKAPSTESTLRKAAEQRAIFRARGSAAQAPASRRPARLLVPTWLVVASVASLAPRAWAGSFDFDRLPDRFQYSQYAGLFEQKTHTTALLRNDIRPVEAPTRYDVKTILRYTLPLGDTGMELRLKAPLKPQKIVKLELRF